MFINSFNKHVLKNAVFIYFEREIESSRGGAEREGGRERILSRPRAVCTEPDVGLDLTEITT